jgi:hypothetical protein
VNKRKRVALLKRRIKKRKDKDRARGNGKARN